MLRGTLVLWAGLLTIVVLHRRLHIHNWFGMVLIVAGAAIVGASRYIFLVQPCTYTSARQLDLPLGQAA